MSTLHVYTHEQHQRSKLWYIWFGVVFVCMIILSLRYSNRLGAVILFLVLGGYLFFSLIEKKIDLTISESWLQSGPTLTPWTSIRQFGIEYDPAHRDITTIIITISNKQHIHTIDDTQDRIKSFVVDLHEYVELVPEIVITGSDRIVRLLKL